MVCQKSPSPGGALLSKRMEAAWKSRCEICEIQIPGGSEVGFFKVLPLGYTNRGFRGRHPTRTQLLANSYAEYFKEPWARVYLALLIRSDHSPQTLRCCGPGLEVEDFEVKQSGANALQSSTQSPCTQPAKRKAESI